MTDEEVLAYVRAEIALEEQKLARVQIKGGSYRVDALRAILRILETLPEQNLWARAMGAK